MEPVKKKKFIILRNESNNDFLPWIKACEKFNSEVTYKVVNLTLSDWFEKICDLGCDHYLAKPAGRTSLFKQVYDERIRIITEVLQLPVFPSLNEILIYENKRYLASWLKANRIPHPATCVFFHKDEAADFLRSASFPLVAKINIGASGNGITILKSIAEAMEYINRIFSSGVASVTGPKLAKGKIFQRAFKKLTHPAELKEKLSSYKAIANDPQRGFCLFQEFIHHDYEWRVVRIGNSFFAHKKIKSGEKASGTLIKGYEDPPFSLLDFVEAITSRYGLFSQAVDIFEPSNGTYLVNEMQCIFGQSDPFQMLIGDKPGRYLRKNGIWIFEEGDFASNQCYDLRVRYILDSLSQK